MIILSKQWIILTPQYFFKKYTLAYAYIASSRQKRQEDQKKAAKNYKWVSNH